MSAAFLVFRDKSFRKKLLTIALPIAAQNLINFGVSLADIFMVGQIGEIQLSATALSNQFSFLFMVIAFGVASGCGVLSAQYWGADNRQEVRKIFAFMYRIIAVLNLAFAAVAILSPAQVLNFIIDDPQVVAYGIVYLRIIGLGYLAWGFTIATISALRSTGTVKIAVIVSLTSLLVGVTLNYALIFGNFGFPALGVQGAAIGTVIARFFELSILIFYLFKVEKNICFRFCNLVGQVTGVAKSFLRHSSPVVFNEILWASANFLVIVIIGQIGREFVAANTIGSLLIQLVGVVVFGITNATGTIIGNTIGAGKYEEAKQYANGMLVVSFGLGVLSCLVVQAVRIPMISFFTLTATTRLYVEQLTHVISIIMIFMPVAIVSLMGTLRGGGDTRFVMIVDAIFVWLIAIPFGALAGLVLNWPIYIVFLILRSEDIFKTMVVLWRVPRGKWLKDITRMP